MERDIYTALKTWKTSKHRKPLVLEGARQVGKTHALRTWGARDYPNVAYFNFEQDPSLAAFFDGTLDPKALLTHLQLHSGLTIEPASTLIIFDEVQICPRALNSLKYFCEEAGEYHIAAAESLLGVKTSGSAGFPVGKVQFLSMYPLSFFEFLSAIDKADLRDYLEKYTTFDPLPEPLHNKLIRLLKFYLYIGGMPEAVARYAESGKLDDIRTIQLDILSAYERDFAKHAPKSQIMKIMTVWQQVPQQLAKENKKFIFSAIRESARGRDYEEAIQWLSDAGLIYKCLHITAPRLPLAAAANQNIFKLLMLDVGLLGASSQLPAKAITEGNQLFIEFKGALIENFVAQELVAARGSALYYWSSQGSAEVDYLIQDEHDVLPLEVKSGKTSRKKSLLVYGDKYGASLARCSPMNLKRDGRITNYPLYLASRFPMECEQKE